MSLYCRRGYGYAILVALISYPLPFSEVCSFMYTVFITHKKYSHQVFSEVFLNLNAYGVVSTLRTASHKYSKTWPKCFNQRFDVHYSI